MNISSYILKKFSNPLPSTAGRDTVDPQYIKAPCALC